MSDEQIASTTRPVAFISSFTREFGDLEEDGSARKDGLRYTAWALGEELGKPVWVPAHHPHKVLKSTQPPIWLGFAWFSPGSHWAI